MSDGDNATPGLPSSSGSGAAGDNQWLTRSPRPSPGAAPWERSGNPEPEDNEPTGNHTEGDAWALVVPGSSAAVHPDRTPRLEDIAATAAALAGADTTGMAGQPLLRP